MYIQQIYSGYQSAAAYYIESDGEAAILDPNREANKYLELARQRGAVIKYVFGTYFQADAIRGALDVVDLTKSKIIFGPFTQSRDDIHTAFDGEEFKLGFISLKVLHTPGFTPDSCCYLLLDERHNPHSVFTGNTLFVDDVGCPGQIFNTKMDRAVQAGLLYDSIQKKLIILPNYVVVYPGHCAGFASRKSIGVEPYSTIGNQKKSNYALRAKNREDFIRMITENY